MDKWYKARIHKPELVPQLYFIETSKIFSSIDEKMSSKLYWNFQKLKII